MPGAIFPPPILVAESPTIIRGYEERKGENHDGDGASFSGQETMHEFWGDGSERGPRGVLRRISWGVDTGSLTGPPEAIVPSSKPEKFLDFL